MKSALLYLSAPLLVAVLAPLALMLELAPYPPIVLVGAIPVVLVFSCLVALPLYCLIPKPWRVQVMPMLAASFVAGFASFLLCNWVGSGIDPSQVGQVVLIENGHMTAAGWELLLAQAFWIGILSMPGGLLSWLAAKVRKPAV